MSRYNGPRPEFKGMWWDPADGLDRPDAVLRECWVLLTAGDVQNQLLDPVAWDSRARWGKSAYGKAVMPGGGRLRSREVVPTSRGVDVRAVHRSGDRVETEVLISLSIARSEKEGTAVGGLVSSHDLMVSNTVAVFTVNRIGACFDDLFLLALRGQALEVVEPTAHELLGYGAAFAVCGHLTPEELLQVLVPEPVLGPEPAGAVGLWLDQQPLGGRSDQRLTGVEAARLAGATVTWEEFSLHAVQGAAELSLGGSCAAVFRSVNADGHFAWAVNGEVLRDFDPLYNDGVDALAEEHELDFEEDPIGASLELVHRLTGVDLSGDAFGRRTDRIAVVAKG